MGYFKRSLIEQARDALRDDKPDEAFILLTELLVGLDGCLAKVDDDEPIFVLRAQDRSMIDTMVDWLGLNRRLAVAKYLEVNDHIRTVNTWQVAHPDRVKIAD